MFSPDTTIYSIHGTAPRNPRRRARNDSDSVRYQSHRKRSKLSDETFAASGNEKINGNGSTGMNGSVTNGTRAASHTLDMPVREKKASGAAKRSPKSDNHIVLTRNANYSVKKLPSLPAHIHKHPEEPYRGFILPKSSYALTLTHNNALIFDYTSNQRATPRTLNLPHILKQSDPIPIGSLVQAGPSNDLGLVVVYPKTGKIVFWENVDSAESLSLFQQRRQGVEGAISGLYAGESVIDIVDASVSGFILTFSTGRLAQLTIRDAQGRPSISVSFLRAPGAGGIFGSLKNVFSGSLWRKEIAGVRQRKTQEKGQSDIVAATRAGSFQLWTVGWTGQHTLRAEVNVHDDLLALLKDSSEPELRGHHTEVNLLDFVLNSESREESRETALSVYSDDTERLFSVLVIVAIQGPSERGYALVELDFNKSRSTSQNTASIRRLIPINAYEEDKVENPSAKLLLPKPGRMAIVVFSKAIVIASLAESRQDAEAQLLGEYGTPPPLYQDVLYLDQKTNVTFVGFGEEEPSHSEQSAKCIIFARGCGILRLTAENPDKGKQTVTVKNKIEQAVFFASSPHSIFDFTPKAINEFSPAEIEAAAEQISKEIIKSSSGYVPAILPSMEQHLNMRAQSLSELARHLKINYPPLSRKSKWALLRNAEKIAAAEGIWRHYEERCQKDIKQRPLAREMVDILHEKYKTGLNPAIGEVDLVRQWFIKDVGNIETFLPWAFNCIRLVYGEGTMNQRSVMQLIDEADDMVIKALTAAFNFREEHVAAYGLEDEPLVDAVLTTGYQGLPCPWTASHNVADASRQLVYLAIKIAGDFEPDDATTEDDAQLRKIALDNPTLVRLCSQVYSERYTWLSEQDDPKQKASGRDVKRDFLTRVRPDMTAKLAEIGQADAGMKLAEKFRDMTTLVLLVGGECSYFKDSMTKPDSTPEIKVESAKQLREMDHRIENYFNTFKDEWANAWYSWHIQNGQAAVMLDDRYSGQHYLTKFLRSDQSRAKLSWINDVLNEKDLVAASISLTSATNREPNIWCKKMEASMAKLTLMAAAEEDPNLNSRNGIVDLQFNAEHSLRLISVQEKTYDFLRDEVLSALDYESALDVCMDKFGTEYVADERDALRQLLRQGFEQLIHHRSLTPELLIDVLTLMNDDPEDESRAISRTQFGLALQVLECQWARLDADQRDETLKLIWKRSLLRDDWEAINQTSGRSDRQVQETLKTTVLFFAMRESALQSEIWSVPLPTVPILPSASLSAFTTPASLRTRFHDAALQQPLLQANIADDATIAHLVESARLDHWFSAVKNLVVEDILAEQRAAVLQITRLTEARLLYEALETQFEEFGFGDEGSEGTEGSGGFEGDDERGLEGDVDMD